MVRLIDVSPGFSPDNIRLQRVPEPVIEDRTRRGIRQYTLLDILVVSLVLGYLLARLVKHHHHIVFYPDNRFNHDRPSIPDFFFFIPS
jgi:hypothetical protein